MKNNIGYAPVSVIIPCYNCINTIERAIISIIHQTLIPAEVILIDDCSDDSTVEYLNGLKNQYTNDWLKVVCLKVNSGPATARNFGWDIANHEYIAFLDSDDSWHPLKIEVQYSWMKNNSFAVMSAHSTEVYENSKESYNFSGTFKKVLMKDILISNTIPTRSVMLKRDVDLRFPEGKKYAEDYLLWLQIINKYNNVFFTKKTLAYSHKGVFDDDGLSGDLWFMHLGLLETYKCLYKEKRITFSILIFLYTFSFLKLFVRYFKKFIS